MKSNPFSNLKAVRKSLSTSQSELAGLLGVSVRAVQSYEQGWRQPPEHVQKTASLLLYLANRAKGHKHLPCWQIRECGEEQRASCSVYRLKAGDLCWLISGNMCNGKKITSWKDKLAQCMECPVMELYVLP